MYLRMRDWEVLYFWRNAGQKLFGCCATLKQRRKDLNLSLVWQPLSRTSYGHDFSFSLQLDTMPGFEAHPDLAGTLGPTFNLQVFLGLYLIQPLECRLHKVIYGGGPLGNCASLRIAASCMIDALLR